MGPWKARTAGPLGRRSATPSWDFSGEARRNGPLDGSEGSSDPSARADDLQRLLEDFTVAEDVHAVEERHEVGDAPLAEDD